MKKKKFRLGELFCGPGGIACGAHNAHSQDGKLTIEHAWASDFDPDTCLTYAHNICGGDNSSVYCEDVRELNIDALAEIDAFAYGFPCNSFSNVGEHEGLDNCSLPRKTQKTDKQNTKNPPGQAAPWRIKIIFKRLYKAI